MTTYHKLKQQILDLEEWKLDKDERDNIIETIDKLYDDFLKAKKKRNNKDGHYGLIYYTIHDDSSYYDEHKVYFETKKERDQVYEDWNKGLYWDKLFNREIEYPTPSPNYNHGKTIKTNKKWVLTEEEEN